MQQSKTDQLNSNGFTLCQKICKAAQDHPIREGNPSTEEYVNNDVIACQWLQMFELNWIKLFESQTDLFYAS